MNYLIHKPVYALAIFLCSLFIVFAFYSGAKKQNAYQAEGERLRKDCLSGNIGSCHVYENDY